MCNFSFLFTFFVFFWNQWPSYDDFLKSNSYDDVLAKFNTMWGNNDLLSLIIDRSSGSIGCLMLAQLLMLKIFTSIGIVWLISWGAPKRVSSSLLLGTWPCMFVGNKKTTSLFHLFQKTKIIEMKLTHRWHRVMVFFRKCTIQSWTCTCNGLVR